MCCTNTRLPEPIPAPSLRHPTMTLPDHLLLRLCWLLFGAGFGLFQVMEAWPQRQIGLGLSGLGMVMLGLSWFLNPKVGGRPIGPKTLQDVLMFGGVTALVLGLVLRYLAKV